MKTACIWAFLLHSVFKLQPCLCILRTNPKQLKTSQNTAFASYNHVLSSPPAAKKFCASTVRISWRVWTSLMSCSSGRLAQVEGQLSGHVVFEGTSLSLPQKALGRASKIESVYPNCQSTKPAPKYTTPGSYGEIIYNWDQWGQLCNQNLGHLLRFLRRLCGPEAFSCTSKVWMCESDAWTFRRWNPIKHICPACRQS